MSDFQPRQPVKYLQVSRGGYGYVTPVVATFVRYTGSGSKRRATIEVTVESSGRKKRISVKPINLVPFATTEAAQ